VGQNLDLSASDGLLILEFAGSGFEGQGKRPEDKGQKNNNLKAKSSNSNPKSAI
jgi:hypothetical protein